MHSNIQGVCSSATASNRRDQLIKQLAHSITQRPINKEKLDTARQDMIQELGEGFLVELAAATGAIEMATKLADCSGKSGTVEESGMMMVFLKIWAFLNWILDLFRTYTNKRTKLE